MVLRGTTLRLGLAAAFVTALMSAAQTENLLDSDSAYPYASELLTDRTARIDAAKRRAKEFREAAKLRQHLPLSYDEQMRQHETRASEAVMGDATLQPGDVISTNKGMFLFKGRVDRERRLNDFVRIGP